MIAGVPEDLVSRFWAFARGDTSPQEFENWFLAEPGLEEVLGKELHWDLTSSSYKDRDEVCRLRQVLAAALTPSKICECNSVRDLAAINMGGEEDAEGKFHSDHVFANLDSLVEWGPAKWWLYISKCRSCSTIWLIAQEERIYDIFFFQRISEADLAKAQAGEWPKRFSTYEDVLTVGGEISYPCRFLDPMAASLQWAVEDLLIERATITADEIGKLIGVTTQQAEALMRQVETSQAKNGPA